MARRITSRTVAEAEKLADLHYTADERRVAASSYRRWSATFDEIRSAELANSEGPAGWFDPRLPGMRFETTERAFVRSTGYPRRLPEADEDIAFAPVVWLSRWIESRQLTSERLTRIYLERLQRHDATLHCVITLLERDALASARRADREIAHGRYRGPLHGIPWGAKDLLDTKGVRTTWGATPYRDRVTSNDATVVRRLADAGAVLIAKLSLGALAYGDVWFGGKTRSPWDRRRGSSGSSAGSAAAVAAGLVGFAIGSETMGSIVAPSERCGVVGLRPTFGRVPRTGAMALSWTMDKLGPMVRRVEDAALVLDAIRGPDGLDETVIDLPFNFSARKRTASLRVGYVPADFRGERASPRARALLAHVRALGVTPEPIQLPAIPLRGLRPILSVEAAAAFDELTRSDRDDELVRQQPSAWPNTFRTARLFPAVEYVQATRLRRRLMRQLQPAFDRIDVVLCPGSRSDLVSGTNYTGHPTLTFRMAVEDRQPVATTLVGRLFGEAELLRLGMVLEGRFGAWHVRPPLT